MPDWLSGFIIILVVGGFASLIGFGVYQSVLDGREIRQQAVDCFAQGGDSFDYVAALGRYVCLDRPNITIIPEKTK